MKERILLEEKDFTKLVEGGIIETEGVQISLQDIDYDLMLQIIKNNQEKPWKN